MGVLEQVRRRDDRRHRRGHRQGRGPRAVPRGDEEDRPRRRRIVPRQRIRPQAARPRPAMRAGSREIEAAPAARPRRRARAPPSSATGTAEEPERKKRYVYRALGEAMLALAEIGLPAIIRPSFTLAGTGGGIAYDHDEFIDIVERGLDASPTNEVLIEESVLGWKEFEMEVVRDKRGQLHHRLLDRERRSDGRAHRRFDHHRAGADAHRQGIPDHARRLDRGAARDRGRDRRLQRAVRRQPGRRPPGRHRDEPARVALLRARVQGDRLPDRQGRGQARGRLHARRDRQRHHRRRDAGLVRADHRLRGHQDPALRVREIPRRRAGADHLDEVGRRGDGDRPHLPGEPAEGAALARDRPHRPRRDRDRRARAGRRQERDPRRARHADARPPAQGRAGDAARLHRRRDPRAPAGSIRGSSREIRGIVDMEAEIKAKGLPATRRHLAPAQGDGLLRRAARQAHRACRPRR